MEVFKCFHGMNPMYLNNLFRKQEIKYDLSYKTLLEQPKLSTKTYGYRSFKYYGSNLLNALPFEIKDTDSYDEFKLRLTNLCHSSDLDRFWNILIFFSLWLNYHCYPIWQGSRGQHGADLGSVGPRWAHVGPMNFAIRDYYHYCHRHFYHHHYDESLFYIPNVLEWVSSDLFFYFKIYCTFASKCVSLK